MRAKNPWRRARTRLLGWKVRFIVVKPESIKTAAVTGGLGLGARLVERRPQVKLDRMHLPLDSHADNAITLIR